MLNIRAKIFKSVQTFYRLLIKIKDKILQGGKKSKRHRKDTSFDILKKAFL